jgi:Tol biopolymer transport system component/DNA-binding winged helix-turn-helix (wHTH) protein
MVTPNRSAPGVYRFGDFELDVRSGRLWNGQGEQFLPEQPLALITALAERPGELVTREELRRRLWPDGTFVDSEHGLNSAVNRLREALNDSAGAPKFVETVPRRGYRLLVPVEGSDADAGGANAVASAVGGSTGLWTRYRWLAWCGTGAAVLAVAVLMIQRSRTSGPAPLLASVIIELPDEWHILDQSLAVSTDGRSIVFSASHESGRRAIWMRPLAASDAHMLAQTEDGSSPFWSPSGDAIGFFAGGKLKLLRVREGSLRVVCDAPSDSSGSWASRGVVLFAPDAAGAVAEVDTESGVLRRVTKVDRANGERAHIRPTWLPDAHHFVYLTVRGDEHIAMLASVDGDRPTPLGPVQSHVEIDATGHALFVANRNLAAQRLDVANRRLTGDVRVLADDLTLPGPFYAGRFSASRPVLVYFPKNDPGLPPGELGVFDRGGRRIGTIGDPGMYTSPIFSPDGNRVAVARANTFGRPREIWVFDPAHGTRVRVTLDAHDNVSPRWSGDGEWLVFSSDRRGTRDIYRHRASGEGPDELLFESAANKSVNAVSPDGRYIVYDTGAVGAGGSSDLYALPLFDDRRPFAVSTADGVQNQAAISPDHRLIAYASSESGRYEVIVETFPEKRGRWQISTDGGRAPAWRGDGRELFFVVGDAVFATDLNRSGDGLEWGPLHSIFKIPDLQRLPMGLTVSADGQRFVAAVAPAAPPQRLTTVLNWTALLK